MLTAEQRGTNRATFTCGVLGGIAPRESSGRASVTVIGGEYSARLAMPDGALDCGAHATKAINDEKINNDFFENILLVSIARLFSSKSNVKM